MIDFAELFKLDIPFLEIFIRGTCVYLGLLLLMRMGPTRQVGSVSVSDMLVLVLLADAAQNAMAGGYESITSGLVLVAVILFWDYAIDWLTFQFPSIDKFLMRKTVCLVKNGKILHRNVKSVWMTKDELLSELRINEIDEVKKVKAAFLESNGEVSVIKYKS